MTPCPKCSGERIRSSAGRLRCPPCDNAYQRRRYALDPDLIRTRKRESMAKKRKTPEGRAKQNESSRRAWLNGGREKQRARVKELQADRFAWAARQHRFKFKVAMSSEELRTLWYSQGGLCALSGRVLDAATAHLDHRVPQARGGGHGVENLRWLDPEVNLAKRDLLDEEFLALCRQVLIEEAESVA